MTHNTQLNKINAAIGLLSEGHREILTLICIKEVSYAQAATLMNTSEKSMRHVLSAARAALHNILEKSASDMREIYGDPWKLNFLPALKAV